MSDDSEPYSVAERLSRRLERFLLLARPLAAGNVQSTYEVGGATTLVAGMHPVMNTFRFGWFSGLGRRTVHLTGEEAPAVAAVDALSEAADVKREGMVARAFDVALTRFTRSDSDDSPYEHLATWRRRSRRR